MQSLVENSYEAMNGEVEKSAGAAVDNQSTVDSEPVLPEDLVSESDGKITDDTPGESVEPAAAAAVPEPDVPKREAVASTDWNNAPVVGWTAADAPVGLDSVTAPVESSAAPDQSGGVLGSVPAVEKPPLQVYNFYMVRVPRPVDTQGKTDISSAEQQLQDKTDARNAQNSTVQAARVKRNEALEKLKSARQVEREWLALVREKWEAIKPLRDDLKKLKEAGRAVREKSRDMPTSEEELNHRIAALEWRIQHESIPLKEEKQLMRDIKALQSSRETVRANAPLFAQVNECLGQRDELEATLRPLDVEYKQLDAELKKAIQVREAAGKEYDQMDAAMNAVYDKLHSANDKRQEAYVHRKSLKEQEYFRMKDFYDNKNNIQEAKLMAIQPNNRKAVEEYCNSQVERMLEVWNTDDEYRKNYVKDNEVSYLRRFGTLDGRSLGPDEARPILPDRYGAGPASSGPGSQQNGGRSQKEAVPARAEKAEKAGAVGKEVAATPSPVVEEKLVAKREVAKEEGVSIPVEEAKSKEELEQEAAELKEQRRATEMAKAKEAEERKKRVAEKSQAKALAWAQKEAERKEKEKEKKARKKAVAVAPTESDSLSDSAPAAESNGSVAGTQEAAPKEVTKVSSSQRKRGVTPASKAAARMARANAPMPPIRAKQQKVLGLPLQVILGAGAGVGVVLLAVVVYFLFLKSSGSGSSGFEQGAKFKERPDASSQSF